MKKVKSKKTVTKGKPSVSTKKTKSKKSKGSGDFDTEGLKGIRFVTAVGRLSFPKLFEPTSYKKSDKKHYEVELLLPKALNLSEMRKKIRAAVVEKFGKNKDTWPKINMPWKDGDEREDFESYQGCMYIKAKTGEKFKPTIVDGNKKAVDESEVYGGRYARLGLCAKLTTDGSEWYVSLYLQSVQVLELSKAQIKKLEDESEGELDWSPGKGESFGGSSSDMFDDEYLGDLDATDEDEDDDDTEDDDDDDSDDDDTDDEDDEDEESEDDDDEDDDLDDEDED